MSLCACGPICACGPMSLCACLCKRLGARKSKKRRMFGTSPSRVVPHLSTTDASWCLSSKFEWVSLLSPVYDRT